MDGKVVAKVAIPKERKIDWDYDEEADVLYISFGKPRPAVGIDIGKGIIMRYDEKKKEITGMTVVGLRGALLDSLKK